MEGLAEKGQGKIVVKTFWWPSEGEGEGREREEKLNEKEILKEAMIQ